MSKRFLSRQLPHSFTIKLHKFIRNLVYVVSEGCVTDIGESSFDSAPSPCSCFLCMLCLHCNILFFNNLCSSANKYQLTAPRKRAREGRRKRLQWILISIHVRWQKMLIKTHLGSAADRNLTCNLILLALFSLCCAHDNDDIVWEAFYSIFHLPAKYFASFCWNWPFLHTTQWVFLMVLGWMPQLPTENDFFSPRTECGSVAFKTKNCLILKFDSIKQNIWD